MSATYDLDNHINVELFCYEIGGIGGAGAAAGRAARPAPAVRATRQQEAKNRTPFRWSLSAEKLGVVHPTQLLANRHLVKLGLIKSERKKTLSIIDHAATLQEIRRP
ncbi:hypothetical protein EVAR_74616_1 [Eumeta japonica]|uniref:Uncharacterized protein n=1 Tax=Eumeta variegata TaxID=151549 RepID=A0A4C1WAP2_EUMVA|nr:hypothetical protein EVAR_74616_1 [Eumeta japonica]